MTVVLNSTPVTLGTLTPDASGTVAGQFAIPAATAAGAHTIVLTGTGADGAARTVTMGITVSAASGSAATSGSAAAGTTTLPRTGADLGRLTDLAVVLALLGLLIGAAGEWWRPKSKGSVAG